MLPSLQTHLADYGQHQREQSWKKRHSLPRKYNLSSFFYNLERILKEFQKTVSLLFLFISSLVRLRVEVVSMAVNQFPDGLLAPA